MKRLLKLFFVITLLFTAGCGAGKPDLTGEYEVVKLTAEDRDMTDELELIKSMGVNITLVLNKDGTGTLNMIGQSMSLTYDVNKMTMKIEDSEDTPFTYKDGIIAFSEDGSVMEFKRIKKE